MYIAVIAEIIQSSIIGVCKNSRIVQKLQNNFWKMLML